MTDQEQPNPDSQSLDPVPEVSLGLERQVTPPTPKEAKLEITNKGAGSYRNLLMKRTDFPYVVTLLFAFFAWVVTHTVDRVIALPLVKFTQTIEGQADGHRLTIKFENITSNVNFKNLNIRILGETVENRFSAPSTTVIGGGWDAESNLFEKGDAVDLMFSDFHPGWRLRLTTNMIGGGTPRVQLVSADVPAILEPAGLRTWLVEWELYIIALFAILALIFILVWAREHKGGL